MASLSLTGKQLTAIAAIVLFSAGFLYPGSDTPPFAPLDRFCDALHLPIFFMAAVALQYLLGRRFKSAAGSFIYPGCAAVFMAAAIECIQPALGRSASIVDAVYGVLGSLLGIWFAVLLKHGFPKRSGILLLLASAAAIAAAFLPAWNEWQVYRWQQNRFPHLAGFDDVQELRLWRPYALKSAENTSMSITADPENESENALELRLPKAKWAGVEYSANQFDWEPFDELQIDIYNPGEPLALRVRIDDDGKSKSYYSRFTSVHEIAHGTSRISIAASTIKAFPFNRPFRLNRIVYLRLFVGRSSLPATILIKNMRLVGREPSPEENN